LRLCRYGGALGFLQGGFGLGTMCVQSGEHSQQRP
jgi:hypothetical protein